MAVKKEITDISQHAGATQASQKYTVTITTKNGALHSDQNYLVQVQIEGRRVDFLYAVGFPADMEEAAAEAISHKYFKAG